MKIAITSDRPSLKGDIKGLVDSLYLMIIDMDTVSYHSLSNPFCDQDETDPETTLVFHLNAEDVQIIFAAEIPPPADIALAKAGILTLVRELGTVQEELERFKRFLNKLNYYCLE